MTIYKSRKKTSLRNTKFSLLNINIDHSILKIINRRIYYHYYTQKILFIYEVKKYLNF